MDTSPRAFISYSHSDREFVVQLAEDLRRESVDVWLDKFEINPGDSLIQKIFSEGLSQSEYFLVVLSKESVKSRWVQEELSTALSLKLEGVIHIIPVLKEQCEIPVALRSLLYVDLSSDYSNGIRRLVESMYSVNQKPPIGRVPEYISSLKKSVGGLSREASTLGYLLISNLKDDLGYDPQLSFQQVSEILANMDPATINSAVDELEAYGLVKAHRVVGNAPFNFAYIQGTYALFLHFREVLSEYDPEIDIKQVAAYVFSNKVATGLDMVTALQLPPGRINRAVSYLEDY